MMSGPDRKDGGKKNGTRAAATTRLTDCSQGVAQGQDRWCEVNDIQEGTGRVKGVTSNTTTVI